jgi:hypothetical protein
MGALFALDLQTFMAVAPADSAPNGKFVSTNIPTMTNGAKGAGSYGVAGDVDGNLFNGEGIYTSAHDTVSDSIWFSKYAVSAGGIGVFPRECLTSKPSCSGFAWYDNPDTGWIGPMSALKDGRIVGATRFTGNIYILSLKNPADRTAGLNAIKIGTVNGDPYMYTDFTGATLYVAESDMSFKMSDFEGFKVGKPVVNASFKWLVKVGALTRDWKDIKIESRCYMADAAKPEFEETPVIPSADTLSPLTATSCNGKVVDRIDLKLTQLKGATTLVDVVGAVQVSIAQ